MLTRGKNGKSFKIVHGHSKLHLLHIGLVGRVELLTSYPKYVFILYWLTVNGVFSVEY